MEQYFSCNQATKNALIELNEHMMILFNLKNGLTEQIHLHQFDPNSQVVVYQARLLLYFIEPTLEEITSVLESFDDICDTNYDLFQNGLSCLFRFPFLFSSRNGGVCCPPQVKACLEQKPRVYSLLPQWGRGTRGHGTSYDCLSSRPKVVL